MTPQLTQLINHEIILMGPSLFEPDKLESVKLVGVESTGIWIESEAALDRIVDKFRVRPSAPGLAFFIPFTQITTILASFGPTPGE